MEPRRYGPFPYSPITERPPLKWPGGARIALWVAPNIEFFPLDEKVFMGIGIVPDVLSWSHREYGNRVGIWRIMEVLDRYGIRATVALNSEVCDACPQIVAAGVERGWEFMGHNQSNSRPLNQVAPEREGEVVAATFDRIEKATGARPRGWLSGGLIESWDTLDHLIDAGCEYVCDWVVDDQPFVMDVDGRRLVSIPYSGESNDFGAFMRFGWTADQFAEMLCRQFDVLYRESEVSGKVMVISLHGFLIGVAHRIGALEKALDHILGHDEIWFATGGEILDHFLASGAAS
jgi:peptidoglycan/xylan/chitin deacetylase (PgdA/CDA1 family)